MHLKLAQVVLLFFFFLQKITDKFTSRYITLNCLLYSFTANGVGYSRVRQTISLSTCPDHAIGDCVATYSRNESFGKILLASI